MSRFWALALKELRQIRRDRRLTISLIVPPTLQILLFGFALDSNVRNLQLGVIEGREVFPLVFPCRRTERGWVNASTGEAVLFDPSHWRDWPVEN